MDETTKKQLIAAFSTFLDKPDTRIVFMRPAIEAEPKDGNAYFEPGATAYVLVSAGPINEVENTVQKLIEDSGLRASQTPIVTYVARSADPRNCVSCGHPARSHDEDGCHEPNENLSQPVRECTCNLTRELLVKRYGCVMEESK